VQIAVKNLLLQLKIKNSINKKAIHNLKDALLAVLTTDKTKIAAADVLLTVRQDSNLMLYAIAAEFKQQYLFNHHKESLFIAATATVQ
jgi:hypothetical protein